MWHPHAMATGDLLTVADVVERYQTSERPVRRWLAEGRIPGARQNQIGRADGTWRLPEDAVRSIWPLRDPDMASGDAVKSGDAWQVTAEYLQAQNDGLERRLTQAESDLEMERSERQRLEVAVARSEASESAMRERVEASEKRAEMDAQRIESVETSLDEARSREQQLMTELAEARGQMTWRARRRARRQNQ